MKRINGMKHLTATIILALSAVQMLSAQHSGRPAAPGAPAAEEQALVPDSSFVVETPAADSTAAAADGLINDYSMLGINYGVTFSNMYYSPSRHNRAYIFAPNYISIMYTKYSKMFGFIPYFGLTMGVALGNEGFRFKPNPQTGYVDNLDGAERGSIRVIEIPAMAQMHADFEPLKLMINAGIYGGWRLGIERSGENLDPQWAGSFREYENRFDYGFQGGAGFAIMLDPVEIHFNCHLRWSWSSLQQPDYASSYYYEYAYPLDIYATVGLHFQITRRRGKTRSVLRREAYDIVYGKTQDSTGQDR